MTSPTNLSAWPVEGREGVSVDDLPAVLRSRRGGASLRDVGAACGLSASALCRIEAGGAPDLNTMRRLSAWLGAPIVISGPTCPCGSPVSPDGLCTDTECPAARGCA